ncbi:hypothetical protein TNCV_2885941 [Trichonephila clavipes]|nr:hypothetical protein TNCV_2885941 [Trichonephila clavipes]
MHLRLPTRGIRILTPYLVAQQGPKPDSNTARNEGCLNVIYGLKDFLRLNNEHIFGGDQGYTLEIMDEILTTARDLESEVNEDDIEELIMGHEDELTIEALQEIMNEEHEETQ